MTSNHPASGVAGSPSAYPSELERLRTEDLFRLLPTGCCSSLEIGPRSGYHTRDLARRFPKVTAADLIRPTFDIPGVLSLQADVRHLPFADASFDCVLCAEVLEHVNNLQQAASEIQRVTRLYAVVGVPYRQDLRCGRLTCSECGAKNPPYGHINTFDKNTLIALFSTMRPVQISFIGQRRDRTNALATWLFDLAGNPWGTYGQEEPCIRCGSRMRRPNSRTLFQRLCSRSAHAINQLQRLLARPTPAWLHVLFKKA